MTVTALSNMDILINGYPLKMIQKYTFLTESKTNTYNRFFFLKCVCWPGTEPRGTQRHSVGCQPRASSSCLMLAVWVLQLPRRKPQDSSFIGRTAGAWKFQSRGNAVVPGWEECPGGKLPVDTE